ncbi:DUF1853 family protein [Pseudoduganella namucuonensis]|uniref:DUF1853 family protein n=1 Tax=Pseudoduganella namucuonensis TaxID=1035707 RepID=A0A1I7M4N0_9BURK|nr:DUF1853 family protein [Pseudoduganella namucuonensis]SFV16906.1 hypothetical protein SAMN05216552_105615 [Pseudoduganella namucuonensis]
MPDALDSGYTFQARFERHWSHLTRPHVRALAWLLEAPDLLDPVSPHWHGRVATLGPVSDATRAWLAALERDPAPLDAALGGRVYSRLGLYAEKLMAFYFDQHGMLAAHGLQVRANRNDTVGEFDFLLREGGLLLHYEFATKFYLLDNLADAAGFNHLVGPNLADTLGLKIRKTFARQLELANHPAAQAVLPGPVDKAQALVKGWLFHPPGEARALDGISADHCRGYWTTLGEFAAAHADATAGNAAGPRYVVMPRLQWLAPLKVRLAAPGDAPALPGTILPVERAAALDAETLALAVLARFELEASPVMAATVREEGGWLIETGRGFITPDDWRERAAARRAKGALPL